MFKANRFLAIIALFLFVVSCRGGGSPPSDGSPQDITHYELLTDLDGTVRFTLLDGSVETVKILDQQTGSVIPEVKVIFITDGTEGVYLLWDESGNYTPRIVNAKAETLETASVRSKSEIIRPRVIRNY